MNVWLRRLLMLLIVLVWFAIMISPALAFILARNGQFQIGPTDGRHWRVFLVQEADAEGLGLERSKPVAPPGDAPESVSCLQTSVDYLMWIGVGFNVDYCQCTDAATGDMTDFVPPACLLP
jgi:hypothetical protein